MVAVSDAHWIALYAPVVNVVALNLSVFVDQKKRLGDDYVKQFVQLVRRNRGGGQDDLLLVHVHTYCLVVSFSALYLARLMRPFDYFSISLSQKTAGERNQIFPWLEIPNKSEIKLRKAARVLPVAAYAFPILNSMISSIGWHWVHGSPLVMQSLFDAVYSDAESGKFSDLLGMMNAAPLEKASSSKVESKPLQDELISELESKQQESHDAAGVINEPNQTSEDSALDELQSLLNLSNNKAPAGELEQNS